MNFLLQGLWCYTATECDKTNSCHENQGSSEELPLHKALPQEDVKQRGLVGSVLSSNRTRVRRNSRLKALCGLKVTWRQGKLQVKVL